jgi:cell wall-associated NlpC family hydrolase
MAKAKAKRVKGRPAPSRTRAAGPAKSKKSKKSLKARKATPPRARRRPARKATARRAVTRRPAARKAKGKRPKAVVKRARTRTRPVPRVKAKPVRKPAATPVKAAKAPTPTRTTSAPATPSKPVVKTAAAVPVVAPPAPVRTARPARKALPPRKLPALDRERRRLPEADVVPSPPSSLDLNRSASAARSGQAEIAEHLADHTETSPEITGGDVDATWESAYSTGDEAPGGDNPTPDQDVVDDIGRSLGLVYEDSEELKGADKITERDKHRWELDPASAEDFDER